MRIAKFKKPLNEDEVSARMLVLEDHGDKLLVRDLRFVHNSEWHIPPSNLYFKADLEIVSEEER